MRTIAPAKINWTLEVLGRRGDGYHEIRSVMQTIDLCDEVWAEPAEAGKLEAENGSPLAEDDLIVRAARALEARVGRQLPARVRVRKRIPLASGLGGGSSDAAAVLRLLDRLHGIGLSADDLAKVAAHIGSDVSFFAHGGTALVEGIGERVTSLPDLAETWLVLVAPPIGVADKTKRMYEALNDCDFCAGSRGEVLSQRLRRGEPVREEDIHNTFERVAYKVFEGLVTYRDALLTAGAEVAHVAGAGPALFAMAEREAVAKDLGQRVQVSGAKVCVARTLGAREATAVESVKG